jgi:Tol biopolymer transport system component
MIVVSIETGDSREVTHPREGIFDYFVNWTPDGKSVLFSTNRFSENLSLYRYNLPDATSEKYVDSMVVSVSWNPSGNHFVYAVSNNGFNEIYTRNLFTGEEVLLNEGFIILHENYTRPVWSPDGSLVAFEAIDREATVYRIGIFILNLDNSEIIRITSNTNNEYGPYWIPCLP